MHRPGRLRVAWGTGRRRRTVSGWCAWPTRGGGRAPATAEDPSASTRAHRSVGRGASIRRASDCAKPRISIGRSTRPRLSDEPAGPWFRPWQAIRRRSRRPTASPPHQVRSIARRGSDAPRPTTSSKTWRAAVRPSRPGPSASRARSSSESDHATLSRAGWTQLRIRSGGARPCRWRRPRAGLLRAPCPGRTWGRS